MDGVQRLAERVPARLSASDGRRFALTLGAAFVAIASVTWWRGHMLIGAVLGATGVLLAAAGIIMPSRLGPISRGWMAFALAISKVTTPFFLGVVYYLVIAPIGVTMRLFGHNPLARKSNDGSFWVARHADEDRRGTMKDQF